MADDAHETIEVTRDDAGVVTVTMNRPRVKNALSDRMFIELESTFGSLRDDADARVLVLTGAGGDFCSGADLGAPPEIRDANGLARMRRLHRLARALHDVPQPKIARIPGIAAGAGLSLALGCDLTIASDAARFSAIFSRRGLSTDMGAAWLLPRLVGLHRAKQLALFGEVIDATEAERIGLVNRVVPAADLDATVDDWATRLAAGPPVALTQIIDLLDRAFETPFDALLADEGAAQALCFTTADTREAMTAFFEKRDPAYQGR